MLTPQSISDLVGGELYYPSKVQEELLINGAAPLGTANKGDLSFFVEPRFQESLRESRASLVILNEKQEDLSIAQLIHPNPRFAMAKACQVLYQNKKSFSGRSKLSYVHEKAKVHDKASLFPFSYVDEGSVVEEDCFLYPGVHIGSDCRVGKGSIIYPNCVLMDGTIVGENVTIHAGSVLGGDGFGFVPIKDENVKVPQIGNVVIEDNVEIGPLCTIDRATFDKTIIRKGTKFDSQVHVGHNVDIGELSLVCAQVAFGGCAKVGKRFIAAGQSAIGTSVNLGDSVSLGPKSGAMQDEEESGEYLGTPLSKKGDWIRQRMAIRKLPKLHREHSILLKRVEELEKKLELLLKGKA